MFGGMERENWEIGEKVSSGGERKKGGRKVKCVCVRFVVVVVDAISSPLCEVFLIGNSIILELREALSESVHPTPTRPQRL